MIPLTVELCVNSSAVIQSWIKGRPVVEEEMRSRYSRFEGPMSDDTEKILRHVRF